MRQNRWAGLAIVIGMMAGFGAAARPAQAEESLEQSLGAATAFALYDVQMVIGLTADAFAKKVYEAETVNEIVGEQKTMMTNLDKHLAGLRKLDSISAEDKKALKSLSECIALLQETADALLEYVEDQSDENAEEFQTARKASHAALAEIMGLDKK